MDSSEQLHINKYVHSPNKICTLVFESTFCLTGENFTRTPGSQKVPSDLLSSPPYHWFRHFKPDFVAARVVVGNRFQRTHVDSSFMFESLVMFCIIPIPFPL